MVSLEDPSFTYCDVEMDRKMQQRFFLGCSGNFNATRFHKNSSQRERSGFAMKRTSNGVSALRSCLSGKRYGIRKDAVSLEDPSFTYCNVEMDRKM